MGKSLCKFGSLMLAVVMFFTMTAVSFHILSAKASNDVLSGTSDGIIPTTTGSNHVVNMEEGFGTSGWWSPSAFGQLLREIPYDGGIKYDFNINVLPTVGIRQGMNILSNLDGLTMHFDNLAHYTGYAGHGRFAIGLSKGAGYADPGNASVASTGSIFLIVNTIDGTLELAKLNGSSYDQKGTALITNDLLKHDNIANKPFSIKLTKNADGSYNIIFTVHKQEITANNALSSETVSVLKDANGDEKVVVVPMTWFDGCFSFDFKSINCEPNNWTIPSENNLSIPKENVQSWWGSYLTINGVAGDGGLQYTFTGAIPGVREGVNQNFALDGMTLYFEKLNDTKETPGSFVLCLSNNQSDNPGDPNDYVNALFLLFDFSAGEIQRAIATGNAEASFMTETLVAWEKLKYSNVANKPFSIGFNVNNANGLDINLSVGSETYTKAGAISAEALAGITNFTDYLNVYPCVSAWYGSAGLSVVFRSINRQINENEEVDNVIAAINAIGTVSINSSAAIKNARELYNALSDAKKALVTNYSVLEKAEADYSKLLSESDEGLIKMSISNSMLTGSGSPVSGNTINNDWKNLIKIEDIATGGLRYHFTGSVRDVREGYLKSVALDGLFLLFDGINADAANSCSLTIYVGNSKPPYGPESSHNPLILTLDPANGKIVANPSGKTVLQSDMLKLDSIKGNRFSYLFNINDNNQLELTMSVQGTNVTGTIPESVLSAATGLTDLSACYVMVTNWEMATYSVDFIGLKQTKAIPVDPVVEVTEMIDSIGLVTIDSKPLIDAALAAYDALSAEDQSSIENYITLQAAKEYYDTLEYNDMIQTCENLIDDIGEVSHTSGKAIEAVQLQLNRLNAEQKAKVSNLSKFNAAVAKYHDIIDEMMYMETAVNGFSTGTNALRVPNGAIPSWTGYMTSTVLENGAMHIDWNNAIRDMRNGSTESFALNGLYIRWANLTREKDKDGAKLSVQIGPEDEYRENGDCIALVFDTMAGTLTAYPSNKVLLTNDLLKHDNIEGKEVSMSFTYTDEMLYYLTIMIGEDRLSCTLPSSLILNPTLQIRNFVKVALSPWVNDPDGGHDVSGHTFSVDFLSVRSGSKYAFEDVYTLIETISKLPKNPTLADETEILAALKQYSDLPQNLKKMVTNYDVLGNALNAYYELTQDDYSKWENASGVNGNGSGSNSTSDSDMPSTGDNFNLQWFMLLIAISGLSIMTIVVYHAKAGKSGRKEQNND